MNLCNTETKEPSPCIYFSKGTTPDDVTWVVKYDEQIDKVIEYDSETIYYAIRI